MPKYCLIVLGIILGGLGTGLAGPSNLIHQILASGEELRDYCVQSSASSSSSTSKLPRRETEYANSFDRRDARSSLAASFQLLSLSYGIKALAAYALALGWDKDLYEKTVQDLSISCSPNISVISRNAIKQELLARFEENDSLSFKIPLPEKISSDKEEEKNFLERGMTLTLTSFRRVCGAPMSEQGAKNFLRSPVLGALTIAHLLGNHEFLREKKSSFSSVLCSNFICRRGSVRDIERSFPRQLGGLGLGMELRQIYCGEFYREQISEKYAAEILHWISLYAGVPSYFNDSDLADGDRLVQFEYFRAIEDWKRKGLESVRLKYSYQHAMNLVLLPLRETPGGLSFLLEYRKGPLDSLFFGIGRPKIQFRIKLPARVIHHAQAIVRDALIFPKEAKGNDARVGEAKELVKKHLELALSEEFKKIDSEFNLAFDERQIEDINDMFFKRIENDLKERKPLPFPLLKSNEIELSFLVSYAPFALREIANSLRTKLFGP